MAEIAISAKKQKQNNDLGEWRDAMQRSPGTKAVQREKIKQNTRTDARASALTAS
jgi:hypothetical protein